MTFSKCALHRRVVEAKNRKASVSQQPHLLRPIKRNTYGPHPLLNSFAVIAGSLAALSGVFVLQSTVLAQVSPATVRASGSFTPPNAGNGAPRVAVTKAGTVPAIPVSFVGVSSASTGPVRVGAPVPATLGTKPVAAVLATGEGPLSDKVDVASVQLASLIQEMPEGDLGPLVLASGAITLNARSRDDIGAGQVDQRVLAMLLAVSFDHKVEVTVIRSGHNKYVKGTKRLSNHISGRAVDIGGVDGRLVRPSNKAARSIVDQLLGLPSPIRPTEIGSPWDTDDPETFTDSGHDDHLHIGFDS
jgi:hypothetical protein